MVKGKLIIIEAGDGCGKATQTKLLYDRLNQAGYKSSMYTGKNVFAR